MGWVWFAVSLGIYCITMAPTVSFWDCGEFITTNYGFEVGHPPGAPLYQLIAHLFTLLAPTPMQVAFWSNMLSVVAGAATVMFLFWTLCHLLLSAEANNNTNDNEGQSSGCHRNRYLMVAASVGALSYCFCDTAWFSVVESEVYSLAMLFASVVLWAMVRWYRCADETYAPRWLILVAFLLGLSVCVHLMSWLTIPALLLLYIFKKVTQHKQNREQIGDHIVVTQSNLLHRKGRALVTVAFCLFFFLLGFTPYLIVLLRAQANPAINQGNPSTPEALLSYVKREQYENGPMIYPRIWRQHPTDAENYAQWSGFHGRTIGDDGQVCYQPNWKDNIQFFATYQLQYMYLRYFMWNFSGRYNDRQGYGSLQNGQFITGISFVDHLLVGTGKTPPSSMARAGRHVYFLFPFLLGLWGLFYQSKRHPRGFWTIAMLFLVSGVGLAVYLNMPAYQPRERDYAFVLSFYAYCIWINFGALAAMEWWNHKITARKNPAPVWLQHVAPIVVCLIPLWMMIQNWDYNHNRSDNYLARDSARNMLNSCNANAILFTLGDNDTFPLWYVQQVEGCRGDVQIINLNLLTTPWYASQISAQLRQKGANLLPMEGKDATSVVDLMRGSQAMLAILTNDEDSEGTNYQRPVYFSHYAYDDYKEFFSGYFQLSGFVYRLQPVCCDSVACSEGYTHALKDISWQIPNTRRPGVDATSQRFLNQYCTDILLLVENLNDRQQYTQAAQVLKKTLKEIPIQKIDDLTIRYAFIEQSARAGLLKGSDLKAQTAALRSLLKTHLDYYHTLSPTYQGYISYTLQPLEDLAAKIL